jgi:CHASE2 domain-containing sensor protein
VAGSSSPKWSDDLRSTSVLVVVTVVILALLQALGITDAIDASLRSTYYRMGSTSETAQRVLVVEADDDTVRAWGDPAWPDERRRELLERIAAGRPTAVVLLDRPRMFASTPAEDDVLPGAVPLVQLEPRIDPRASLVESVDQAVLPPAWLQPVTRALGLPPLTGEPLRIHYLSPSRLPTVEIHRIAQGDVPSSIFEDKVVVVGLTSLTHRDALPTPVGALTTPEIVGHALAMLADGRQWYEPPWSRRALGLGGLLLVLVLALRKATPAQAIVRAMGLAMVVVAADLAAFTSNVACWGVANELLLVLTAVLVYWYFAQRSNAALVKTMSAQITEQVVDQQPASPPREWFWRDMAEVLGSYLDVDVAVTAVLAELPAGQWHLEPRAYMGMTASDVFERRRDVRRSPYRAAFLTLRATRCDRRFVADEQRYTIAVPLAFQGRLLGMWMVSLPHGVELAPSELEAIEQLGKELGRSIADLRRAEEESRSLFESSNVGMRLSHLFSGMEAIGEEKQRILDMFEALPLGLLVADVWGHVLQQNPEIQRRLALELPDGIPNNDLCAVLSRISGRSIEGVHGLMRATVREGKVFRLPVRRAVGREATYVLMSMRSGSSDESSTVVDATTRLVLIAVPDVIGEAVAAERSLADAVPLVFDPAKRKSGPHLAATGSDGEAQQPVPLAATGSDGEAQEPVLLARPAERKSGPHLAATGSDGAAQEAVPSARPAERKSGPHLAATGSDGAVQEAVPSARPAERKSGPHLAATGSDGAAQAAVPSARPAERKSGPHLAATATDEAIPSPRQAERKSGPHDAVTTTVPEVAAHEPQVVAPEPVPNVAAREAVPAEPPRSRRTRKDRRAAAGRGRAKVAAPEPVPQDTAPAPAAAPRSRRTRKDRRVAATRARTNVVTPEPVPQDTASGPVPHVAMAEPAAHDVVPEPAAHDVVSVPAARDAVFEPAAHDAVPEPVKREVTGPEVADPEAEADPDSESAESELPKPKPRLLRLA